MGSHISTALSNKVLISISTQNNAHYNLAEQQNSKAQTQPVQYPSFLKVNHKNEIEYSLRSNYQQRFYEFEHHSNDTHNLFKIKKISSKSPQIWLLLKQNQKRQISQGTVFRMGEAVFQVKKICLSYDQVESWDEHDKTIQQICEQVQNSRKLSNYNSRHVPQRTIEMGSPYHPDAETCRYCYGREVQANNPLLSMCRCSGSVRLSHYQCLRKWITSRSVCRMTPYYEYREYQLQCQVCRSAIPQVIENKGVKYSIFSQGLMHPPYLVLQKKAQDSKTRQYTINFYDNNTILVGKGSHAQLRLNQNTISKQHCEFSLQQGRLYLSNLAPAYGTMLQAQGEPILLSEEVTFIVRNQMIRLREDVSGICCVKATRIQFQLSEDYLYS